MSTKLRSGRIIEPRMDELSGLFSKSMKFTKPIITKTKATLSDDDILSSMFGKLTIGKTIGKTKRKKGARLTRKKTRKIPKPTGMDLSGGKRKRTRRRTTRRKY